MVRTLNVGALPGAAVFFLPTCCWVLLREQLCQEVLLALVSEDTGQNSAWIYISLDGFLMSSGPQAPLGPQDHTGLLVVLFCPAQPSSVIRTPQITLLFVLCGEVSSPNRVMGVLCVV